MLDLPTGQLALADASRRPCDDPTYSSAGRWTGQGYHTSGHAGLRLLLIGERPLGVLPVHEERPGAEAQARVANRTCRRFWRNVVRMIQGECQAIDSELFWHKIAYVTCLQVEPPPGKRSPSPEMWKEGQRAIESLVPQLAPDCVVALGYRLYDHVAQLGTAGPEPEISSYSYANRLALVAKVKNPLAPGFHWQQEALKIKRAITLTKLMNMG